MDPVPTSPEPGNFTVPLLFGWGDILLVLVLLVAAVVVLLLVTASTPAAGRRSEWQAWLDARSRTADAEPEDERGERKLTPPGGEPWRSTASTGPGWPMPRN